MLVKYRFCIHFFIFACRNVFLIISDVSSYSVFHEGWEKAHQMKQNRVDLVNQSR